MVKGSVEGSITWGLISGLKSLKKEGGGSSGVGIGQGEIGEEEFDKQIRFAKGRGRPYEKKKNFEHKQPQTTCQGFIKLLKLTTIWKVKVPNSCLDIWYHKR